MPPKDPYSLPSKGVASTPAVQGWWKGGLSLGHRLTLADITRLHRPTDRPGLLDCPFIFHGRGCGKAGLDKRGRPKPCLGNFRKSWATACAAIGMPGRIPHDLRRSGVKHYIEAGVDPHVVMGWSGHRTESMLRRYNIIDLDDLPARR